MRGFPSLIRGSLLAVLVAIASFVPLTVSTPLGRVTAPVGSVDAAILPIDWVAMRVTFSEVDDALDPFNLNPTQHLISQMNARNISVNQLVSAIQSGPRFFDTKTGGTVYYQNGLAVIRTGNDIATAYFGPVKSRWQPL